MSLIMVCSFSNAQIKVDASGKIGLKSSSTSANYDIFLNGSTNIYGSPFTLTNGYGNYLNISSNYASVIIEPQSTNNGALGTANKQFSEIHGNSYWCGTSNFQSSDKRYKENFRTIESPLTKILNVEGLKYDYIISDIDSIKDEKAKEKQLKISKNKIGFLAQDLEKIIPEAVFYDEEIDKYYIEYDAIIPVIVEAMKEQQAKIELLEDEIEAMNDKSKDKSATINTYAPEGIAASNTPSLGQNIPNPFNVSTRIDIYIPNTTASAKLYIYNMQGSQVKSFNINERGNTSITIEGSSLEAGMYLYTLIADGREVDTKKMILTK